MMEHNQEKSLKIIEKNHSPNLEIFSKFWPKNLPNFYKKVFFFNLRLFEEFSNFFSQNYQNFAVSVFCFVETFQKIKLYFL